MLFEIPRSFEENQLLIHQLALEQQYIDDYDKNPLLKNKRLNKLKSEHKITSTKEALI